MDVKKCDRCGVYFEPNKNNYLFLKAKKIIDESTFMFGDEMDLCSMCQEEFYEFMNKYKEVIKNEKK